MENEEKYRNNSDMNIDPGATEAVIGRLKAALDVTSDGQLAKNLGITRQNIGAARKRDDVPPGWIYKVAEISGYSMDWLRFGHGPQKRVVYAKGGSRIKGELASQQSPYKRQASPKPGSANELAIDEDISGFGTAVEMLAKIYGSEDQLLIGSINANLRAFCESVDRRQKDQRASKELSNLKKRLVKLEKRLQRNKPA